MPFYLIKHPDGGVFATHIFPLWNGYGSTVMSNGPIIQYIIEYLNTKEEKTLFVCQNADGHYDIPAEFLNIAKQEDASVVAVAVAGTGNPDHFFYCPASDEFFVNSVFHTFTQHRVPWEQKKDCMVWRGGVSGQMWRVDAVKRCVNVPNTDVKFVDQWSREYCNPTITPELFGEKVGINEQCRYKALLYLDGNSSASNATWIFATGSVPVFISIHEYWFRHLLVPWVHYVPIEWDLSDLESKLQWIWEHDDEARKIAENALEFSRTYLSCEYQREYIRKEIDRLCS